MENSNILKPAAPRIWRVTLVWSFVFAVVTMIVVAGEHFWPSNFLLWRFLVGVPAYHFTHIVGFDESLIRSAALADAFCVLINAILGALLFLTTKAAWKIFLVI